MPKSQGLVLYYNASTPQEAAKARLVFIRMGLRIKLISMEELDEYPCLSFDQGRNSSLYLAEEMKSTYDYKRLIKANDRATLLNFMIGLNAYTLCSGIICEELNGSDYMAIPLKETEKMRIGYVKRKGASISHIGQIYIEELKKYKEKIM